MSWKEGQVPNMVWLSREDLGARKANRKTIKGCGTRLMVGSVTCWTTEPSHKPGKFVCYRLVPIKSKLGVKKASK